MVEINTWPGWECVRQLGAGSFGKVYEIQKIENGKAYKAALKVITIPQSDAEIENAYSEGMDELAVTQYFKSFVDDVTNEFALMADLKGYTNIVSYEDHMIVKHNGRIGWDILIKMELLTPLLRWAAEHPLGEADVIKLGCDMCRALELCHKNKIIHRDIKPQNIFINKNGDFKLGDFGIARVVEKTSSALSQKGTYTYMAPEVYKGKKYNETADIYSLGIVLYRFLNYNRAPFLPLGNMNYHDQQQALERRMAGQGIPAPAKGSIGLKYAVLMTLQYEPSKRVQSATALRHMLEKCRTEWESIDNAIPMVPTASRIPDEDLEPTIPVVPVEEIEPTIPVVPVEEIEPTIPVVPDEELEPTVPIMSDEETKITEPEEKIEEVETTGGSEKKRFWIWIGVAFAACCMFIWIDYSGMKFTIQYEEPITLGDDLLSGNIEIEGDLYHLPAPISAFTDNGWRIASELRAGKLFRLEKDDKRLYVSTKSFEDYQFENYVVDDVSIYDYGNISTTLPGNISFDSDKTEVEALLFHEYGFNRFVYDAYYSYEYYDRDIHVIVEVDRESEKVDYLSVTSYAESYD